MHNQINETAACRIFWEKTKQQGARILRVFASVPAAAIPSQINGCPVTEIGSYCFAGTRRLPEHFLTAYMPSARQQETNMITQQMAELCGSYVESVSLPDTVYKIGDYAFYDCRKLYQISFGSGLEMIGSDAFMNCHNLKHLRAGCSACEKTGLRRMLAQIPWDVEVSFWGRKNPESRKLKEPEAAIFYPEYYESYDEIAPAHIFGRSIVGEGFRARQSFKDGILDYAQYDTIFKKACAEESIQTMCRLSLCRLRYPVHLSKENKTRYEHYIQENGQPLCSQLIQKKQLAELAFLFQNRLLSSDDAAKAVLSAAQAGWSEGSASLLRWKQEFYPDKKRARYEFEDF